MDDQGQRLNNPYAIRQAAANATELTGVIAAASHGPDEVELLVWSPAREAAANVADYVGLISCRHYQVREQVEESALHELAALAASWWCDVVDVDANIEPYTAEHRILLHWTMRAEVTPYTMLSAMAAVY
ncbi:hypothetical protein [uncultured Tessaracoccus sp.]|uniref:hypothetical protein n=1 Tax=uncultured Tessaracoccus sp. TaxID=905023 RepID=UPI0026032D87|nr:hypothetical protein [uncultured Tessaracoccus sp.]